MNSILYFFYFVYFGISEHNLSDWLCQVVQDWGGFLACKVPFAKTRCILGKLRQLVTLTLWHQFTLVGLKDRSENIQTFAREYVFSKSFLRCSLKGRLLSIIWNRVVFLDEINHEHTDEKLLSVFYEISFLFLLSSSKISFFMLTEQNVCCCCC